MVYNPNIPQPNDDPTQSQSSILQNFGKINSDWLVNHVALTAGANNGFHTLVEYAGVLGSDPTVSGLQSSVYPKNGLTTGIPQLFFNNFLSSFQLTGLDVVNGTISGLTTGATTTITSPGHGMTGSPSVTFYNVGGVTGINGITFTATVVNNNTFTIGTTSGAWTGGGFFTSPNSSNYGFVSPWGFIFNMGQVSGSVSGGKAYYAIPFNSAPNGFEIFTALGTLVSGTGSPVITNVTNYNYATFTPANATIYFLVIGQNT